MIPGADGVTMQYPQKFVEKVQAEYWDRPDIMAAASGGGFGLGALLARGATMTTSLEGIAPVDSCDRQQIRDCAARRRLLHAEWMRIVLRSLAEARNFQPFSFLPPPSARPRPWSYFPVSA